MPIPSDLPPGVSSSDPHLTGEDVPTPDQSYCDLDMHQQCSGYTEDESDAETCMCSCHDETSDGQEG